MEEELLQQEMECRYQLPAYYSLSPWVGEMQEAGVKNGNESHTQGLMNVSEVKMSQRQGWYLIEVS